MAGSKSASRTASAPPERGSTDRQRRVEVGRRLDGGLRHTLEDIERAADGAVDFDPACDRLDVLESNLEEVAGYLDDVDPTASVGAAVENPQ